MAAKLALAIALAALLAGCGRGAPTAGANPAAPPVAGANPSPDAPTSAASPASTDVDAAMTACSDIGGGDAPRIAACSAVIESPAAPAVTRERALNNRGVVLSLEGNLDRAIADYDAAIAIDPTYAAAFYNRAKAWKRKGDEARADADSAEAVRLDPGLAGR